MAVHGVHDSLPALTSILNNQSRNTDLLISTPPAVARPLNINLPQQDAVLIQTQTFINETLQNLTSTQQGGLRLNEALNGLSFAQQVDFLNQSRLFLNEGLQGLGPPRQSALLIDAEALVDTALINLNSTQQADLIAQTERLLNEALQNLPPPQQATLLIRAEALINETLQNLNTGSRATVLNEATFFNAEPVNVFQNQPSSQPTVPPTGVTVSERTSLGITPLAEAQIQRQGVQITVPPTPQARTIAATPVAVTELIPGTPFAVEPLMPVDPIPYGIAVYEVNNLRLTTLDPEPEPKTVRPTPPIAKIGIVDMMLFRPEWKKKKESGRPLYIPHNQLTEEEIIRKLITRFNEDQVNSNQPIHLVLAKNKQGLALDIYDCSNNDLCQLVYDSPLTSFELPGLLDNLRHEAGIFVNTAM